AFILAKSRARLLLTVTGFLDTDYVDLLGAERDGLADLEHIVVLRGEAPAGTVTWDEFLAAGDAVDEADAVRRAERVGPGDLSDPAAVLARIPEERISMLPGPPSLYQAILNHPGLADHDISSLRLAVTGAAAIPVELILRMRRELTFETIITGYGLTEACGIATMCRHDDDPETIATTSGRAIPGVEVLVVDDEGKEVPRGEPGEVVVRGYNVMRAYYDEPEETAAAIDAGGWLHTGDVGVMDDRGYLKITDRKKDLFIVGGFNAYPAEIENLMLADERIAQVAVVGVPDERLGEVGVAFVVLRPGEEASADELVSWCRERMANY